MRQVTFDYAGARDIGDVIGNVSGIAIDREFAWTVSDEGRTFECLRINDAGFTLEEQYKLDDFFPDLPAGHEADLESLDVFGGLRAAADLRMEHKRPAPGRPVPVCHRRPARYPRRLRHIGQRAAGRNDSDGRLARLRNGGKGDWQGGLE
ncbi:DUF3616 domain-containing protein [Mesorhizobium sp. ORM8.1]